MANLPRVFAEVKVSAKKREAVIKVYSAGNPEMEPEFAFTPRCADRHPLCVRIKYNNFRSRIKNIADLVDLSTHGCKITCAETMRPGDTVIVWLANLEGWVGEARWAQDGTVGIWFRHPMHPSVVDHILRRFGA